jgi:two-component sensor histidine kinase
MGATVAHRAAADTSAPDALMQLAETVERLSSARSIQDVAAAITSSARRMAGADGATFALREGDECHYLAEDAIGPLWKGLRFSAAGCISCWAMRHGEAVVIPDVLEDERIPSDDYQRTFVRSLVMTPVRHPEPIAAIGVYWAETRTPSPEEIAGLAAVARAAAVALENVAMIASLEHSVKRRDEIIREMDHRVKNNFAVMQAMAQQTMRASPSPEDFNLAFIGRLTVLSRAHELLARETAGEARGEARLDTMMEEALAGLPEGAKGRIGYAGPGVRLGPVPAINMMLALHELATNAVQHGALASPEGRVDLGWSLDSGELVLTWVERGGLPIPTPKRRGFGLRFVQDGLPRTLGGKAETVFEPQGMTLVLTAPLAQVLAAR